ncbi:MAG: XRE family transcriptional regulator [Cytophagales bacterium]|nr:MAG: XRE family transcriptional regulator [Cytophagales bacterium]
MNKTQQTPEQVKAMEEARQAAQQVGHRLGEIAREAGVTRVAIAQHIGITRQNIDRVFNDEKHIVRLDIALLCIKAMNELSGRVPALTLADVIPAPAEPIFLP